MDPQSKEMIEAFIAFLSKELQNDKNLRHLQITKWSLNDYKLTVKYYLHEKQYEMFFDYREIKENQNHFMHLLNSAIGQISEQVNN